MSVLTLLVVQRFSDRHLPSGLVLSSFWSAGFALGASASLLPLTVVRPGVYADPAPNSEQKLKTVSTYRMRRTHMPDGSVVRRRVRRQVVEGNSEAVAMVLYREYLVPFEIASVFLLVAMIGAIVIGKRELGAIEEETAPDFILDRVETEKEVKGRLSD